MSHIARRASYEALSPTGPRDSLQLARVVNEVRAGRLNVIGEVTVTASTTETVISDARFAPGTLIVAMVPHDEASVGLGWWIKTLDRGSITIGHDSGGADRGYFWCALG